MSVLPSLPPNASLLQLFKAFPDPSKPLLELHEILMRGASQFTEGERELIAACVSGLNKCSYCQSIHAATAVLLGMPRESVVHEADDIDAVPVPAKMKPVLRLAGNLTLSPASVTQADADAVLHAGWDELALYQVVAITALFNFMNRLVEGLGIELNDVYVKTASERLARGGYLPLIELTRR